jgi:acyl-CoA synthetase (NDP forming)
MGLYSPANGLSMMSGLPTESGPVGMISQSGANAGDACRSGGLRGLRYSKVISYGNAADLDESDFLEYLAQDDDTEIITGYIEGIRDGAKFLSALKTAGAAKPVIILKGGRTEAGGRATVSHTGSLAGEVKIFDAACRQAGVIRVNSIEELNDCAIALRYLPPITGPRMAIVGVGGGNSVLATDDVSAAGLEVPHLPESTQAALGEFTPVAGTSVRNPVDTNVGFGPEGPKLMQETLRLIAEAPNIDVIMLQASIGWGPGSRAEDQAEHARQIAVSTADAIESFGKPVVMIVRPPMTTEVMAATVAFREEAAEKGLATFSSVASAANALRKRLDWQGQREG